MTIEIAIKCNIPIVVKSFYCEDESTKMSKCKEQCYWCKNKVKDGYKQ